MIRAAIGLAGRGCSGDGGGFYNFIPDVIWTFDMIPPLAKRASVIIWYQLIGSIALKPVFDLS